jgi:hypothetical protein
LSNIYLDRLDQYVEQRLLPEYNLGRRRRPSRAYQVLEYAIARARRHKDKAEARRLILRRRQLPVLGRCGSRPEAACNLCQQSLPASLVPVRSRWDSGLHAVG